MRVLLSTPVCHIAFLAIKAELSHRSGTSLLAIPTDVAELINTEIGAKKNWNGQWTVDCAKVPSLPDFTFTFDGKPYPITAADYILQLQGTCMSGFQGLDIKENLWIVGASLQYLGGIPFRSLPMPQVTYSCASTTLYSTSTRTLSGLPKRSSVS